MRATISRQLPLMPPAVEHVHAAVLEKISEVLDANPTIAGLAYLDLTRGGHGGRGRRGMSGDRAVRVAVLKQLAQLSYEALAFALQDSCTYRRFCKLGLGEPAPRHSALQDNIKRLTPETWELINRLLVGYALEAGVDSGTRLRVDCTPVEANIHPPSDSSLLWDTTRTLTRLMTRAREHLRLQVQDRTVEAKQVNVKIFYGGKGPARDAAYAELMEITTGVCDRAERVVARLRAVRGDRRLRRPAERLAEKIEHFAGLGRRVLDQTRRRVVEQEKVPSGEKVVSIFEPHTDVIVPSQRRVVFGHKVCLTVGESALIIDAVVEEGAPADVTLPVRQVRRAKEILGKTPRQVVFDGAFASRENLKSIKAEGPKDVVFSKAPPNISARDMTASPRTHHLLKKFRAGVEGCISFVKRALGLDRCTWRGEESFASYVWASVVGANLLTIARALLEAT